MASKASRGSQLPLPAPQARVQLLRPRDPKLTSGFFLARPCRSGNLWRKRQCPMASNPENSPEAFCSAELAEAGIGHVVVSRFRWGGELVEAGVFLLDVYCLGVKSAFFTQVSRGEYRDGLLRRLEDNTPLKPLAPSCARKLVEGAVAYAARLGFAPHPDYRKACRVFGGIKAEECSTEFTYGKDGKPLYWQGPHESEAQARQIMEQLHQRCGEGNYNFVLAWSDEEAPAGRHEPG